MKALFLTLIVGFQKKSTRSRKRRRTTFAPKISFLGENGV